MGLGCYRHEVDMGSENAQKALEMLLDRETRRGFPTWGRDSEICPFCYAELLDYAQRAYHLILELWKSGGDTFSWGGVAGLTDLKRDGDSILGDKRHGHGKFDSEDEIHGALLDILD